MLCYARLKYTAAVWSLGRRERKSKESRTTAFPPFARPNLEPQFPVCAPYASTSHLRVASRLQFAQVAQLLVREPRTWDLCASLDGGVLHFALLCGFFLVDWSLVLLVSGSGGFGGLDSMVLWLGFVGWVGYAFTRLSCHLVSWCLGYSVSRSRTYVLTHALTRSLAHLLTYSLTLGFHYAFTDLRAVARSLRDARWTILSLYYPALSFTEG